MRKWTLLLVLTLFPYLAGSGTAASSEAAGSPKRINKAIELLERGQPIYYTGGHGGYEEGRKLAGTWADYINYEMEHGSYDVAALREFMRGLVDGGPTPSGHRTPAVICTLPVGGIDEATMKANYWMVQQVLATGVHGILLCHARTPGAVRVLVQAARYPFHRQGVGSALEEGLRGSGGQGYASQIWGVEGGPLPGACGSLAPESAGRDSPGPQGGRPARPDQRRGEHPGAGRGIRRVGSQRHEIFVAGHETPGRGTLQAAARRPATGLCGLQIGGGRLPQRRASGYGDRHDRRGGHDRVRRAGSRRKGAQAHQAEDALVSLGPARFRAASGRVRLPAGRSRYDVATTFPPDRAVAITVSPGSTSTRPGTGSRPSGRVREPRSGLPSVRESNTSASGTNLVAGREQEGILPVRDASSRTWPPPRGRSPGGSTRFRTRRPMAGSSPHGSNSISRKFQ